MRILKQIFIGLISVLILLAVAGAQVYGDTSLKPVQLDPKIQPGATGMKVSPFAGKHEWAVTFGSDWDWFDKAEDTAVGNDGDIYVLGTFAGTIDFNTNPDGRSARRTSSGVNDVFLCRYDAGGVFKWARTWGGPQSESGFGLTLDGDGNLYATGSFVYNADFKPGAGSVVEVSNGQTDAFLSKFDSYGNFLWARTWGGSGKDEGRAIAIDQDGNVAVAGNFSGGSQGGEAVDFDPGPGTDEKLNMGEADCFISKFDPEGNHLGVLTWGGSDFDYCMDISVASSGVAYVAGSFMSENLDFSNGLKPQDNTRSSNGGSDAYLCRFGKQGIISWVRTWGGDSDDRANGVAVDQNDGTVYVAGDFMLNVNFSGGLGQLPHLTEAVGDPDAFLAKYSSRGEFLWVNTLGGEYWDYCVDVAVSNTGFVYTTGIFMLGADFGSRALPDYRLSKGLVDIFFRKFDSSGDIVWTRTIGGPGRDEALSIALDPIGGVYITGFFTEEINFATAGAVYKYGSLETNAFLCSYPPDGNWEVTFLSPPKKIPMKLGR